ncbi:MAG: hypothetical protein M3163_06985 [Actinomycetota bacterium]|nr:hypothetical protein [Actinomycetota bacterium]
MSTKKKAGLVFGALAMVASGMAVSTTPAGAAFPGINGKIACSSNRTGNFEVFLFDPDNTESGVINITNHPGSDGRPRWRSDGRKIAFESNRAGGSNIFIADADGSNVQQLTFSGNASSPAWHPDGSQLVFQRSFPNLNFEIYKINVDGTGETVLASTPTEDSLPFWSPDGTQIVFSSRRLEGNTQPPDIYTMDSFGNNVTNITNLPAIEDSWPNYSPDGTQIVFHSRRDDPAGEEIYRMPVTGGPAVRLTNNTGPVQGSFDIFPAWSPDGNRIVWNSGRAGGPDGFGEIYTMNASDGGNIIRITNNAATDQRCDWQPLCTIYGSGNITGTEGNDIICGSEGLDRINALGGHDIVYGFGGDDQFIGGDGHDRIFGGLGNDSFIAGPGSDFTSGGPGLDRFSSDGLDRIDPGAPPAGGTDQCAVNGAPVACPPRLS